MNTLVNYLKNKKEVKQVVETVKESHASEIKLDCVKTLTGFILSIPQEFLKSNQAVRSDKLFKITMGNTLDIHETFKNFIPADRWLKKAISETSFVAFEGKGDIKPYFILHEYMNSGENVAGKNYQSKTWACKSHYQIKTTDLVKSDGMEVGTITLEIIK